MKEKGALMGKLACWHLVSVDDLERHKRMKTRFE